MIPIEFPEWVQPAVYIFLGLIVVEIAVTIWSLVRRGSINQKLDQIRSRLDLHNLARRIEEEEYEYESDHWEREA